MPNETATQSTLVDLGKDRAVVGSLRHPDTHEQTAVVFAPTVQGRVLGPEEGPRVIVRFRDVAAVDALIATAKRVRQSMILRARVTAFANPKSIQLYPQSA